MFLARGCRRGAMSLGGSRAMGTLCITGTPPRPAVAQQKHIHMTSVQDYPLVAPLPLPENIEATNANETIQFSPLRSRDISSTELQCHHLAVDMNMHRGDHQYNVDPHVASYDCRGNVNLNCTMQSSVPEPFVGSKFTHLNMPGGQWAQSGKFLSQNLQSIHYTNLRDEVRADWNNKGVFGGPRRSFHCIIARATNPPFAGGQSVLNYSTSPPSPGNEEKAKETPAGAGTTSKKMKLKQTVKEYGSTVVVFHVAISLASLGMFYALVSSGIDVVAVLEYFKLSDSVLASKVGTGASTFVIAYAVHKVFAPVRISITLGATPFIVRALRKRGIIKALNK